MEPQETKIVLDGAPTPSTPIERLFPEKTREATDAVEPERVVLVSGHVRERRRVAEALASTAAPLGAWGMDFLDHELEERTHAAHRLMDVSRRMPMPAGTFEDVMDCCHAAFSGRTPRSAYDAMRRFLYEQCGSGCFGRWLVQRLDLWLPRVADKVRAIVVADVDCLASAIEIVLRYGREKVLHLVVGPQVGMSLAVRTVNVLAYDSAERQVEHLRQSLPDFYPENTAESSNIQVPLAGDAGENPASAPTQELETRTTQEQA